MKRFLSAFFLVSFVLLSAGESELEKVRKEYVKAIREIRKLRIEAIRNDPDLAKLHREIMDKHREMAIRLDAKKGIRLLNDRLPVLEGKLRELEAKARENTLKTTNADSKKQTGPQKNKKRD